MNDGVVKFCLAEFVSQGVRNVVFFVLVRALKKAPFSACEPQTQTPTRFTCLRIFLSQMLECHFRGTCSGRNAALDKILWN